MQTAGSGSGSGAGSGAGVRHQQLPLGFCKFLLQNKSLIKPNSSK